MPTNQKGNVEYTPRPPYIPHWLTIREFYNCYALIWIDAAGRSRQATVPRTRR